MRSFLSYLYNKQNYYTLKNCDFKMVITSFLVKISIKASEMSQIIILSLNPIKGLYSFIFDLTE